MFPPAMHDAQISCLVTRQLRPSHSSGSDHLFALMHASVVACRLQAGEMARCTKCSKCDLVTNRPFRAFTGPAASGTSLPLWLSRALAGAGSPPMLRAGNSSELSKRCLRTGESATGITELETRPWRRHSAPLDAASRALPCLRDEGIKPAEAKDDYG